MAACVTRAGLESEWWRDVWGESQCQGRTLAVSCSSHAVVMSLVLITSGAGAGVTGTGHESVWTRSFPLWALSPGPKWWGRKLRGNIKLISIFCDVCIDGGGGNIKHKDIPITRSPGKNSVFSWFSVPNYLRSGVCWILEERISANRLFVQFSLAGYC